ncbi:hypothetical protein TraAM80_05158 [Trypanosoma rangeli]|uniref:DUF7759 domain-containing protein n=1 Tax=Trypanosoma rangeli TaxID=5698 RepID=A0A3R7NCR5_TRYRA|nr:uncharacterized protein TraAM80_05158 [Trypanosoma rangeli]RNF04443.1 hypothetical protein TraAM80_05158 [Trypanosoma rangeli]|eukprot:RNF04443.1 hypothetical protein TraAM80_05158 [Trypanosoma rangeli]
MAGGSHAPVTEGVAVALNQEQVEQVREVALVNSKSIRRSGERAQKMRIQQQETHENAEDLDAKADDACTANANEAEELLAEPEQHAEEDDVKETYPMVADEDAAADDTSGIEERPQGRLKEGPQATGDTPEPLLFPNNVTIELLTPEEMVIRRESNERKWGLSLESSGEGNERQVHLTSLPELTSKRDARRRHPFYKTFLKPPMKTTWRIQSVNGISSLRAPQLLDIMRRSLKLRIKFFKG